jgi:hypothetical protein
MGCIALDKQEATWIRAGQGGTNWKDVDALINYNASGRGTLELDEGTRLECSFVVQQYGDGRLILDCLCDHPSSGWQLFASHRLKRLCGQTEDGQYITSEGRLTWLELDGSRCKLRAQTIALGDASHEVVAQQFTLTNLIFEGAERNTLPHPVNLFLDDLTLTLRPVEAYVQRVAIVRSLRTVHATAWLRVDGFAPAEAIQVASDTCYALSIVQGHKVNWIEHVGLDVLGRSIWRSLNDRVTKDYTALPLNYYHGNDRLVPLSAATACYPRIRELERSYMWGGRIIDSWLDARGEGDYIESRALKFVVVLESLRSIVLRGQPLRRHLAESPWNSFLEYIIPAAHDILSNQLQCSRDVIAALTDRRKWEDLNRKSFRSDIVATFKRLGVDESKRNIELFVGCRNKIIHEGRFRCQAEPDVGSSEMDAPQTPSAEYSFLASFVDRAILQMFGLKEELSVQ